MTSVLLEQLISLFCKSDTARHRLSSEVFSGRRVGAHELGSEKRTTTKIKSSRQQSNEKELLIVAMMIIVPLELSCSVTVTAN